MSDVRWIDNEVVKGTTKYGVWFAQFGPGATRVDTTYTDGTTAQSRDDCVYRVVWSAPAGEVT